MMIIFYLSTMNWAENMMMTYGYWTQSVDGVVILMRQFSQCDGPNKALTQAQGRINFLCTQVVLNLIDTNFSRTQANLNRPKRNIKSHRLKIFI